MDTKVIYLPTNLNNKLACEAFVHIDAAPRDIIPERVLKNTIVEIRTADNSYPPSHWKVDQIHKLPLDKLGSLMTWPSHGLDMADYWAMAKGTGLTGASAMAVYFYYRYRPEQSSDLKP